MERGESSGSSISPQGNPFDGITPYASSPPPAAVMKKRPCNVFINHRGCDTKHTLASTIYETLVFIGIHAFLDGRELELGDSIPDEIKEAMDTARLHIAIFSPKYAESPWCLAELSYMLQTRTPIIPVFYHVDPSDLRLVDKGIGCYALAFTQHEEKGRYPSNKLQEWKMALQKVSYLSGGLLNQNIGDEGILLKNIVEKVQEMWKKVSVEIAKDPVTTKQLTGRTISEASLWSYVPMNMFGGRGGSHWDDGIYTGIRQIVVRFGAFIDSIKMEYDLNGRSVWSERRGGDGGGQLEKVVFDHPNEVLVSISGKYHTIKDLISVYIAGKYHHSEDSILVTSLTFHTNHKMYGPFGYYGGHDFQTPSIGCKVLGFYGRSGKYLDAIGVHLVMDHRISFGDGSSINK